MKTKTQGPSLPNPLAHGVSAARQRGVVLFFALIVLVILLIGGIVVVRSINASLFGAGNLTFRRDLTTQSDVVIGRAIQAVTAAGNCPTGRPPGTCIANRQADDYPNNYSAVVLPNPNAQGIPNALLLSDSAFSSVFKAENMSSPDGSVSIRYVIERMCNAPGPVVPANCVQSQDNSDAGGTHLGDYHLRAKPVGSALYRLSARVTGPRDTQAFFQTVFSGPS